jgi:magnesium chelatase family protein
LGSHGISDIPPFEAPHHTASNAALVGGGSGVAQPGAITRAHRGVLFMDEAPEFSPRALQTLREPLESGYVALSRAKGTTYYPARFQLVMAANPCPCGFGYGDGERCTCREKDRVRYFSRLSGPILDRIDIQVEVPPVERITGRLATQGACSRDMRLAVSKARAAARERFRERHWSCNAQAGGTWLRENTSRQAVELVNQALERKRLSLRGADRAMRLAWTLADLEGKDSPGKSEMMQGIALRTRLS